MFSKIDKLISFTDYRVTIFTAKKRIIINN